MAAFSANAAVDDDAQLRDDIRSLGRILGDTVREQNGDEIFSIIECCTFGELTGLQIALRERCFPHCAL